MNNYSKPLVRWTMYGKAHPEGFNVLKYSIDNFRNLYRDQFDYCLCYNGFSDSQENFANDLGIILHKQSHEGLPFPPAMVAWKLYPPRLRINAHEIFIDNDLIIWKKLKAIDLFLKSNDAFFCTEGLYRSYGNFERYVPRSVKLNSGLFGIPPDFDFGSRLAKIMIASGQKKWENKWDEQGVVAMILAKQKNFYLIRRRDIQICEDDLHYANNGYHFVHVNDNRSVAWKIYKAKNVV